MFKKILIANRGPIAYGVIQACRELEISTVAVFSQTDNDARSVKMANEAFQLGRPQFNSRQDSYNLCGE